jgi:hypothetical protein
LMRHSSEAAALIGISRRGWMCILHGDEFVAEAGADIQVGEGSVGGHRACHGGQGLAPLTAHLQSGVTS